MPTTGSSANCVLSQFNSGSNMEEDEFQGPAEYGDEEYGDYGDEPPALDADEDMGIPGQQQPQETSMSLGRRDSSREEEDQIQQLKRKLSTALAEASKWRTAFKDVATLVGFTSGAAREPDVQAVVESVQRMKTQGQSMQDELKDLHRREAALQIALSDRNLEAAELRREVASSWAAAEPTLLQLRQLLLDPAVNREYVRMRQELDEAQRELKRVQEELAVAHFTPDSKQGRQLMAKCRSLAEENDQMAAELAEGKVHQLEAQVTLSKGYAEELRLQVADLVEHCTQLNEEVEALQRETFALRRKVKDYEAEGMPDFNQGRIMMGGAPDMGGGSQHMMGGRGYRGRGRGGYRGGGRGGPPGMMGGGGGGGGGPGMRGPPGMMGGGPPGGGMPGGVGHIMMGGRGHVMGGGGGQGLR